MYARIFLRLPSPSIYHNDLDAQYSLYYNMYNDVLFGECSKSIISNL